MAKSEKKPGWWMDKVHDMVGEFVSLETIDGVVREGRLTGLRNDSMTFNGEKVDRIRELEFNGDPTDCVEMYRIARMDLRKSG